MGPNLHFPNDLGPDLLDVIEIVMAYEEAFDDEIPGEEMKRIKKLRSRQELIEYLRRRKKGGNPN